MTRQPSEPTKPASPPGPARAPGATLGEIRLQYDETQASFGRAFGVSVLTHAGALVLLAIIASLLPERVYEAVLPDRLSDRIVWLAEEGPGGGGGGGGNNTPEPPQQAELPGREEITVPVVTAPPEPTPEVEPEPLPSTDINVPVQTMAAADAEAPGLIDVPPAPASSQGVGTGGGAGTGTGTGLGQGQGAGLGEGVGGGTGGGVYQPGNGVTLPQVIRDVKPQYTAEAMRAKVQGTVLLQCVVMPDGTVGNVTIVKSLDSTFGLDQEAIKAAKNWRFRPGTRLGEAVPVLVTIELTFTLR